MAQLVAGGRGRGRWRRVAAALVLLPVAACKPAPATVAAAAPPKPCETSVPVPDPAHPRLGMVEIPAGVSVVGDAAARPEEGPPRPVKVGAFLIDRTEVTNAAYAAFVAATGYRTLAERPLDPAQYPGLTPEQRQPASLVFVGGDTPARRANPLSWWAAVPGASWKHPEGPGSDIKGRESLPVVHVAFEDALAYARWLGRDLPTEAEWEYAARGGLTAKRYAWGDDPQGPGQWKANTWQGLFPVSDDGGDGYKARAAPVACYGANGYGLHDMAGNVWEWTADLYRGNGAAVTDSSFGAPSKSGADHVLKGGSFLCSDDYCYRYRPAARTAGPPDGGASHIGFRTVLRLP